MMKNLLNFEDFSSNEGLFSKQYTQNDVASKRLQQLKDEIFDFDDFDWDKETSIFNENIIKFEYKDIELIIPRVFALGIERIKGELKINGKKIDVSLEILMEYINFFKVKKIELEDRKRYSDRMDYLRKVVYRKRKNGKKN